MTGKVKYNVYGVLIQCYVIYLQNLDGERRIDHLEKELQTIHSRYSASTREVRCRISFFTLMHCSLVLKQS